VFLASYIFYDPEHLPQEYSLLLGEVHRRLDAFCRLPWVPFIYRFTLVVVNRILMEDPEKIKHEHFKYSMSYPDKIDFLTEISKIVVEDRVFGSMLPEYARAVAHGTILLTRTSVDARIEQNLRSIKAPRIRGYRDKGSSRPADKWLPPPPSVVEGYPPDNEEQRTLEDFLKDVKRPP